jgi:Ca-activated chloride channel homolog
MTPRAAAEITALGLKYGLLTDYTSFVAVDEDGPQRRWRRKASVSTSRSHLPAGVSEFAVGSVPSTPEPEFVSLLAAAGAVGWWLRRRQRAKAIDAA